jgi:hypothetical protein
MRPRTQKPKLQRLDQIDQAEEPFHHLIETGNDHPVCTEAFRTWLGEERQQLPEPHSSGDHRELVYEPWWHRSVSIYGFLRALLLLARAHRAVRSDNRLVDEVLFELLDARHVQEETEKFVRADRETFNQLGRTKSESKRLEDYDKFNVRVIELGLQYERETFHVFGVTSNAIVTLTGML